MKYIKLISLVTLLSILIFSCSKKSSVGKMIPKEAAVVIQVNAKSLLSKLSWDEIKKSSWFNEHMSDSSIPANAKPFINDPSKTGIDLNSDIVFFVINPANNGQAVVEGSIKDSKAFADFLKTMHPNGVAGKDGELNVFKGDDAVVEWNDEKFAFATNTGNHNFNMSDSLHTVPLAPPTADLAGFCKNLFSLSDDTSLYKNEKFAKLGQEDGDVHFWVNTSAFTKGAMKNMPSMLAMIKLDKFLDENISTATINFQDGKITGTHKQYFGKELSEILKKGDGNINTDMIKRLSSQNIAGLFAVHFTPANLLEIIKLTGLDGFINLFLAQEGLSLDEIIRATKGDMLFSVSDVKMKEDTLNVPGVDSNFMSNYKHPDATFLFAVAVGDKDAFNKIINLSKTMGKDVTQKNVFQKTDDKYFALSNSQDAVNKYFSGTSSDHDLLSKLNDHPMGGFIDLQMILKALQAEFTKDSIAKNYYNRNIAMWNNVYFTGGEYKDGGIVSNMELNLVDKSTNSLKQLNQYLDDNMKIMSEQKKIQKQQWDSIVVNMKRDSLPGVKKNAVKKVKK